MAKMAAKVTDKVAVGATVGGGGWGHETGSGGYKIPSAKAHGVKAHGVDRQPEWMAW